MPTPLGMAGSRMSRAGNNSTPRNMVQPASASMHQSCLYVSRPLDVKSVANCPELNALKLSLTALERDEINQLKKYGGAEPSGRSAWFSVTLPQTPQHDKYSLRRRREAEPTDAVSSAETANVQLNDKFRQTFPGGFRFNKKTLRSMFREIDKDNSGVITQRELIIALRQHKALLALFSLIQSADVDDVMHDRSDRDLQREEVYRIKGILKEVDTDGSGTMEWPEFVEFFKRAGLLLEYKTQKVLNRTTLCAEHAIDIGDLLAQGDQDFDSKDDEDELAPVTRPIARTKLAQAKRQSNRNDDPLEVERELSTRLFHTVQLLVDDQVLLEGNRGSLDS